MKINCKLNTIIMPLQMYLVVLIAILVDHAVSLAFKETPEPEALLQPRNYNPHPYSEGRGRPRFLTKPTNVHNPGPVQFPPNINSLQGLSHPYAKLTNKGRQFLDRKYEEEDSYQHRPAYDALTKHANKVLNNELKPQLPSKVNQNEEKETSQSKKHYAFSYTVRDRSSGDDFSHTQQQKDGAVSGSYQVQLPDGRIQTVKYTADNNGYRADVSYNDQHGGSSQNTQPINIHHHHGNQLNRDQHFNNPHNYQYHTTHQELDNHNHEHHYHNHQPPSHQYDHQHDYYQHDHHQSTIDNQHNNQNYKVQLTHSNYYTTPDPNYDVPEPSLIETPPPPQPTQPTHPQYDELDHSNYLLANAQPIYDYYKNIQYQSKPIPQPNYDYDQYQDQPNVNVRPNPTPASHNSVLFTPTQTPYTHLNDINNPHVSINGHKNVPLNDRAHSHIFVSTTSAPYPSKPLLHKPGLVAKLVTPTTPSPAYEDISVIPVSKYNVSPTSHHEDYDEHAVGNNNLLTGEIAPYHHSTSERHHSGRHEYKTVIGSTVASQLLLSNPLYN